jgi:Transmembrane protein 231
MESAAVLQYSSPIPLSAVHCGGDLQWIQRKVLDFQKRDDHSEKPVFDQFELSDVLRNYYQRDCKLNFIISKNHDFILSFATRSD